MESTHGVPLGRLFARYPGGILTDIPEVEVSGVTHGPAGQDRATCLSRWSAIPQTATSLSTKLSRGAVAVVGSRLQGEIGVPYVRVGADRLALAYLAAAFHGDPAMHLTVVGVTGTDGKTTTSNLIYQILKTAGTSAGMISTVNASIGDQELDTGFHTTTPDAPEIQDYLARMVRAGISHVVLEATSHGLAQERLRACDFDVGVVTNITHEHLDYHGSYEAYLEAKGRLFRELGRTPDKPLNPPRAAVLNRADESYDYLASQAAVPKVTYGDHFEARLRAEDVIASPGAQEFTVVGPGYRLPVQTSLPGAYNILNCLAAAAVCLEVFALDPQAVALGIEHLPQLPGRMERIDLGQDFTAIVDFAHTPNALRNSLEAARTMTSGRVIAVFGSAGLRDRAKRRLMADVSARLADLTVLTAEDPRTESLEGILAEMAAGAEAAGGVEGESFWRIPDRGEAIRFAVGQARPGDLVIACGKGHEQSMCFGETEYPWDDRTAMRAALSDLLGILGPGMPVLPEA